MQRLAQRLLTETAKDGDPVPDFVAVCEKLRPHLSMLMGKAGFRALLARALTLARRHSPCLEDVRVTDDGVLASPADPEVPVDPESMKAGGEAIVSSLLGLLVTFIGEDLTRRLVLDIWPDPSADEPILKEGDLS